MTGSIRMKEDAKKEYRNLLENVIDWAKKCLEVLRLQRAWKKGQVPEAELAGPIRTTEEEQKLVEEIFNPSTTFPTRKKPASGFDIGSIKIEVYGPKRTPQARQKPKETESAPSETVSPTAAAPAEAARPADERTPIESILPAAPPAPTLPSAAPSTPNRTSEPKQPSLPPAPVNQAPAESIVNGSAPDPNDSGKPRLLVIDDYEPLLNMLARSLKAAGYEPICAKDGVEGIVKLHEKAVDLIITDVQMPKLDGFDLSKMLNVREETRDIPVIFLTEVLDAQTRTVAKRLGAADTIIKPFTMDTLLESVKTVLACHQAVIQPTLDLTEASPEPATIS